MALHDPVEDAKRNTGHNTHEEPDLRTSPQEGPLEAPAQPEVDPLAALRALEDKPVAPVAEAVTALSGASLGTRALKGGKAGPRRHVDGSFQRGALAGLDKATFFAILGDALASIGGAEGPGILPTILAAKRESNALEARKDEVEASRAHDRDMREKDRRLEVAKLDVRVDEGDLDRKSRVDVAQLRVDAQRDNMKDNMEREQEAISLRATAGVKATAVNSLFQGIGEFSDLKLPDHITAEAALNDPAVFEEARRLISPFKQARILQRMESENPSLAKAQALASGNYDQELELWRQGFRRATKAEQDTGLGPVQKVNLPLTERIERSLDIYSPGELADDGLMLREMDDLRTQLREDLLRAGGSYFLMGEEMRNLKDGASEALINAVLTDQLAKARERMLARQVAASDQAFSFESTAEARLRIEREKEVPTTQRVNPLAP